MTFQISDGIAYLGTQCPSTILTIEPTNPMQLNNGKYTMHLEVDEETYWGLVRLGAEIKTDSEPMQKTSSWAMCNPNSIEKLQINCIEEEDGSMTIHIEWDENHPDLQWWTNLGPEGQKTFMIDALRQALDCYVD